LFQVDAFATAPFSGNPAAVIPLAGWLPDPLLQAIAAENGVSETAYLCPLLPGAPADFELRWFTPTQEVDLCGHATLASAHVVLQHLFPLKQEVCFAAQARLLRVQREGTGLCLLGLPRRSVRPGPLAKELCEALRARPREVMLGEELMAVFPSAAQVRALRPDFEALSLLETTGVIATAEGTDCDFVSRYFAPKQGIPEDAVTGSAHCTLVPFWAERLGKNELLARQVSERGGELTCRLQGEQVALTGKAVTYSVGTLSL
jgi:predicted PhzF superfamily epimerase YddE/YHI9